jgi:hypothetical protein
MRFLRKSLFLAHDSKISVFHLQDDYFGHFQHWHRDSNLSILNFVLGAMAAQKVGAHAGDRDA